MLLAAARPSFEIVTAPDPPSIAALIQALPPYARDVGRNLEVLVEDSILDGAAKWGCFLACALAVGVRPVIRAAEAECRDRLTPAEVEAARTTASVMAMNTVYFRAVHLMTDPAYAALPSRLRMGGLKSLGVDRRAAELWAVAVSAVNGCGACLDAHAAEARAAGASAPMIQTALRTAAVVNAASRTMAAEATQWD